MPETNRRQFLQCGIVATLAAGAAGSARAAQRKFTMAYTPGSIGVTVDQGRSIELAAKYGFESVQPFGEQLAREGVERSLDSLQAKGLVWAAASLSVDYRRERARFEEGMEKFPAEVAALGKAGVTRVGTWITPKSDPLTYLENFKRTAGRLRRVAKVLGDQGMRFGLEYVGTKRNWTAGRQPFVHTMAEAKQLIGEIGQPNVGFVLDTWHWWTAGETAQDVRTLTNADIISCDLNDAPNGIERDEQYDNQRELPMATGVIDVRSFLEALVAIGYDGPIRAEPFNKPVNEMEDEDASRVTAQAMKKAFGLVG